MLLIQDIIFCFLSTVSFNSTDWLFLDLPVWPLKELSDQSKSNCTALSHTFLEGFCLVEQLNLSMTHILVRCRGAFYLGQASSSLVIALNAGLMVSKHRHRHAITISVSVIIFAKCFTRSLSWHLLYKLKHWGEFGQKMFIFLRTENWEGELKLVFSL